MSALSSLHPARTLGFSGAPAAFPCSRVERQQVGRAALRREDLCLLDGGRVIVIARAVGAPRLWGLLLDSALDAFVDGHHRSAEGTVSARLHQGILMASHYVRERTDALLDRRDADVYMLAVAIESSALHAVHCGPLQVHVVRQQRLYSLIQREQVDPHMSGERTRRSGDGSEGLRKGSPGYVVEPLAPADLVFAGSEQVLNEALLHQLGHSIGERRVPSAQGLVDSITASAIERGMGAASFALRVSRL